MEKSPEKLSEQFTFDGVEDPRAKICVVGVGGAGGNAVNNMIDEGINNVDFVAINTDAQALANSRAQTIIQAGRRLTNGMGAGARPDVGSESIVESQDQIAEALRGYDLVFIAAGMGGGTGTGGAPIVASIARDLGVLTVAVVTTPFSFEGPKRLETARKGTELLIEKVDTLIVVSNTRLLEVVQDKTSLVDAFAQADGVILRATSGIADLVLTKGLINLDFADIRTTIRSGGRGVIGSATARGEDRADRAAQLALQDPLLDGMQIANARNVLVNITGGADLGLREATRAATIINDAFGDESEFIFGAVIDERMDGDLRVTVVATGRDEDSLHDRAPAPDRVSVERQRTGHSRFNPFEEGARTLTGSTSTVVKPRRSTGELTETSAQMGLQLSENDDLSLLPETSNPADIHEEPIARDDEEELFRELEAAETGVDMDDSNSGEQSTMASDSDITEELTAAGDTHVESESDDTDSGPQKGSPGKAEDPARSAEHELKDGQVTESAPLRSADKPNSRPLPKRSIPSSMQQRRNSIASRWIVAVVVIVCLGAVGAWLVGPEVTEALDQSVSTPGTAQTGAGATVQNTAAAPVERDASDGETQTSNTTTDLDLSAGPNVAALSANERPEQQLSDDIDSGPGPTLGRLSVYAQQDHVVLFLDNLMDEKAPVERVEYRLLDRDGAALSSWSEFPLVPAGRSSYGLQMHKAELDPQILSELDAVQIRAVNGLGESRTHRATVSRDGGL
jgi:cell division protein FtsZ